MAKIHLDRLEKKYGKDLLIGKDYKELMKVIITQNSENISQRIARLNKGHWDQANKKIKAVEKRFVIPDVSEVLPADAIHIRKGAERGMLLSDELRGSLTKNLKETLSQFTPKTKEATYIRRRGIYAGTINPKLVKDFEKKIKETFTNYVKKDPKYGVPGNIREIAVTEVNSTVNNIKHSYMTQMLEKNKNVMVMKDWLHYPNRSKEPRIGHSIVAKQKGKKFTEPFHVPLYRKKGKRWIRVGFDLMQHPHDPYASAEQVISCHCDVQYRVRRIA